MKNTYINLIKNLYFKNFNNFIKNIYVIENPQYFLSYHGLSSFVFYFFKEQLLNYNKNLYSFFKNQYYFHLSNFIKYENFFLKFYNQTKLNNLHFLSLKGFDFNYSLYPIPGIRRINDIDILVHPDDFDKFKKILSLFQFYNSSSYPEMFYNQNLNMQIDVHTSLINITRIPARKYILKDQNYLTKNYKYFIKIHNSNIPIYTLEPHLYLSYLYIHYIYHHGCNNILWLYDVINYIVKFKKNLKLQNFNKIFNNNYIKNNFFSMINLLYFSFFNTDFFNIKTKKNLSFFIIKKLIMNPPSSKEITFIRYLVSFLSIKGIKPKILFLKQSIFPSISVVNKVYSKKSSFSNYIKHLFIITKLSIINFIYILKIFLKREDK